MNEFPDLSQYSNMIAPHKMTDVLNVGWINVAGNFDKGDVPVGVEEKLLAIAGGTETVKALVEPVRNLPVCPICGNVSLISNGKSLPEAEIWVPGNGVFYASPITIIHAISTHGYKPPRPYLDAVMNFDLSAHFDADEVYRQKLVESGWFAARFQKD